MRVVLPYFLSIHNLRNYLLKGLPFFCLCFSLATLGYSQQFTLRDQSEISYQAQLTLMEYESILNLISSSAMPEAAVQDAIRSAYHNRETRIFYSPDVSVEDDLAPSSLEAPDKKAIKAVAYIREFDAQYVKSELETVDFYDFQLSRLKQGDFAYVRLKYTAHFKGRHQQDPALYKPVERVAVLRVGRKNDRWVTYIAGITVYDPAFPITSSKEDVKLNTAVADDGTYAQKLAELKSAQQQHTNDIAIASSWEAFDEKRVRELRQKGEQAEKRRNYEKARQLYTQALQLRPKEATVTARLAALNKTMQAYELLESKFRSGDYVEAINAYSKAIAAAPTDAALYCGRARCYEQLNQVQTALKDYSAAIKIDDTYVDALSSRAKLYKSLAEPRKALSDYSQIIEHLQDVQPEAQAETRSEVLSETQRLASEYYQERAALKQALGDLKGAMADYDAAIKLNPRAAVAHYKKGLIHYQQKQLEEAIAAFSAAIHRDSLLTGAYYSRGLAFVDNQNISSAAVDFERARKTGLSKDEEAAIDNISSQFAVAGAQAMQRKNYKQALENFIKLVLLTPADQVAWVMKGDAHNKLQDADNALQSYTKAIALENESMAYYKRGLLYQQRREYAAAKSDFEKYIPIGWQLISKAESKVASAGSSEALERIAGEIAEGWYALGNAQRLSGHYDEALVSLEKALDIHKTHAEALFARGAVQLALHNYKKAIKDIEKSIKSGIEDSPWVYLALADAYEALGQTDYAISVYTYLIDSVDKEFDLAYIHRAESYKKLKQYPLALQDITRALALNDSLRRDVAFITNKGMVELYDSKFREADQSFDLALSLENNAAWALYGKASILASQNKVEESLPLYRKAFETGEIAWSAIKDDPIIKHVSKQKAFKELVDSSLRL